MTRRRLLLISYHFPPVGGAGVQRAAKFVKYLPQFGWDVSVLQAANPSVPTLDASLMKDIPDETRLVKTRTLEPSYAAKQISENREDGQSGATGLRRTLKQVARRTAGIVLQPDPQILWLPSARRGGLDLLKEVPHHAILATAPSYTNLVLGAMLKARSGLPLVCDYRDEWDLSSRYWENAPGGRFTHAVQQWMQRWVLRRTDAIVATTVASTQKISERARESGTSPLAQCIYNGWDAVDLTCSTNAESAVPSQQNRFRLVYAGTLWNLTDITPLVEAILALTKREPELVQKLDLVVLGRKTPEQEEQLHRLLDAPLALHTPSYAPHDVALATMKTADALLILLSGVPGAERVAPAKLFEYLALRRQLLAITPDGETAQIVREAHPDGWRSTEDTSGIANWLETQLRSWPRQQSVEVPDDIVDRFDRRTLAGQLASLLDGLCLEVQ